MERDERQRATSHAGLNHEPLLTFPTYDMGEPSTDYVHASALVADLEVPGTQL